ncbi:hypothetical protein [Psychromonas sp.]|uniref:hypothetical protein n=1 Tax=Psychromonas sp. TaxID=1884585 RepID=UPI0035612A7F
MWLLIIGMYSAFVFVVIGLFKFLSRLFTNKAIKNAVILLGVLTAISPILFLYIRDSIIAKQLSEYCDNNEGIVVVADIGEQLVEFNSKTDTGQSRDLWRTLLSHPEKSLIINVTHSKLTKKTGRYIFTAMPINSPECVDYDNYIENQWPKSKVGIKKEFAEFSDFCIGISEYDSTDNVIQLEYKTESFPISKNPFYSFREEKASLVDKISGREFAFSKKIYVHRYFRLFEYGSLFDFSTSCSGRNSHSKYLLLSELYK